MKVLVLGANGGTGRLVVERAVEMGHEVSVLVRHAGLSSRTGVRVIEGDALNAEHVLRAMHQQDAVIECIGGNAPWMNQKLEREAMQNIVAAMKESGTRRLLVVSAMGVADSARNSPWWYQLFVVPTFLRGIIADKKAMEKIVRESSLDWIIARPPILTYGAATGDVKVLGARKTGHVITRADLANWLVEQLESESHVGQAVVVVNS
ncbi:MAG: NAD-dependent epimerase/dehydratase family protein [Mucilaginibacter sp.]|nr:NAD-dependent epimerase/dehydratase family protein [Mucilaginibacter sp.]